MLHDTCSPVFFCLIRAKLKYSTRLESMLRRNTREAYCTFLVFDLSVCRCLSLSSFVRKEQLDPGSPTKQAALADVPDGKMAKRRLDV